MKRLIINADDFGIHFSVNRAIITAHNEGILTSTSLLAVGHNFDMAVDMAKSNPGLGIGVHLALVGGFKPLSNPSDIPSIVDSNGRLFSDHTVFLKKWYKKEINFLEVYNELQLQFKKILSTGLLITHVDGHQHLHVLPPILKIVMSLMGEFNINRLRIPEEKLFYLNGNYNLGRFIGKAGLSHYAYRAKKHVKFLNYRFPRYFWGMMWGGNMNEAHMLSTLKDISKLRGSHEIMLHPGDNNHVLAAKFPWSYHWEDELAALVSPKVKAYIQEHNIQLINYGDLE